MYNSTLLPYPPTPSQSNLTPSAHLPTSFLCGVLIGPFLDTKGDNSNVLLTNDLLGTHGLLTTVHCAR